MRTHFAFLALAVALAIGETPVAAAETPAFPYALSWPKEAAFAGAGLSLFGASLLLDSVKPAGDPSALEVSSIPALDRLLLTTEHDAALGTAADLLVIGEAAAPAAALPGLSGRQTLDLGIMYAETLCLAYGANSTLKSLVLRYRPYAYALPPPADIASADIAGSFPSRHATLAFASAVFAGTAFGDLHPDSPYRGLVWAGGLGLAAGVAALRVASGDHFLSDVAAGAALGSLIGFGVPFLHRVAKPAETEKGETSLSFALTPFALSASLSY